MLRWLLRRPNAVQMLLDLAWAHLDHPEDRHLMHLYDRTRGLTDGSRAACRVLERHHREMRRHLSDLTNPKVAFFLRRRHTHAHERPG